jgi:hypothetical protein
MNSINRKFAICIGLLASLLGACKQSSEPPPDILKTQREAMDKAKAVEGQIQKQTQDRMKEVDDSQK